MATTATATTAGTSDAVLEGGLAGMNEVEVRSTTTAALPFASQLATGSRCNFRLSPESMTLTMVCER